MEMMEKYSDVQVCLHLCFVSPISVEQFNGFSVKPRNLV